MTPDERKETLYRAIFDVMGIPPDFIKSSSKTNRAFFARCIACHHLTEFGFTRCEVMQELAIKSCRGIVYILKMYSHEECAYFNQAKERVFNILSKQENEQNEESR